MTKVTLRRLTIVTSHRLTTVTSRRLTALVAALVKHKPSCDVTSSVGETERALQNNLRRCRRRRRRRRQRGLINFSLKDAAANFGFSADCE